MLTDPITLRGLNLSSHTAITALGSTSLARVQEQGGTSVYGPTNDGNGISTTVRVSHSISNENKPNKTSRVLARVDLKGFARDGSLFTAFAYVVVGMPEDGNLYGNAADASAGDSPSKADYVLGQLLGMIAVNNGANTLDETKILRLSAGES